MTLILVWLLFCKIADRLHQNYKSHDAQQATTLTFILWLIDAKLRLGDSAHSETGSDPKTNAQEDVCGDLALKQEVTTRDRVTGQEAREKNLAARRGVSKRNV